jgi:hypothetical protein
MRPRKTLPPVPPPPIGPLPRRKSVPKIVPEADPTNETRDFSDDDLQAAWDFFEKKSYDPALSRALAAVVKNEGGGSAAPDSLPYELACRILRRKARLTEERDLLLRFFYRILGSDATAGDITALAVPPWDGTFTVHIVQPAQGGYETLERGLRPRPAIWEMAARFVRVTQRIDQIPEANEERLARALIALPNESAYKDAAVCIRKIIAETAKKHEDTGDELMRLHRLAQQHAFLYGTYRLGWDHPENRADARAGLFPHVIAAMTTAADLEAIILPYQEIGYQHLTLLNNTDAKRMVAAWGTPNSHAAPRERHRNIWERYRREIARRRTGDMP